MSVRRQDLWNQERCKLSESSAHLVGLIKLSGEIELRAVHPLLQVRLIRRDFQGKAR